MRRRQENGTEPGDTPTSDPAAAPDTEQRIAVGTCVRNRRIRLAIATVLITTTCAWDLSQRNQPNRTEKLFTLEQLRQYDGVKKPLIYLAVLGTVYDVTSGKKHYGPGGGYSSFSAKDCTRALTGDFACQACHDIDDMKPEDLGGVVHWKDFFDKKYIPIGKVVGWYYDARGMPTQRLQAIDAAAAASKAKKEAAAQQPQPKWCNVKWTKAKGKEVWCDEGKYPRQIAHNNPATGKVVMRCACFDSTQHDDGHKLYPGCPATQRTCVEG